MPIKRSQQQAHESLEDFYKRDEWKGGWEIAAKNMLEIIDFLNENFIDTKLIAMTSHQRLCIQNKDDETSGWLVVVQSVGLDGYYIEYKVPNDKAPWENAWIKGTPKSLKEAKKYLVISMLACEGWPGNKELEKLKELI
ncbi:hypothetical protein BKI52_11970 [marine bacterium AO1-C]|nr:hypothetical protein BKI52_11970 [marine bacterium AO1-C]